MWSTVQKVNNKSIYIIFLANFNVFVIIVLIQMYFYFFLLLNKLLNNSLNFSILIVLLICITFFKSKNCGLYVDFFPRLYVLIWYRFCQFWEYCWYRHWLSSFVKGIKELLYFFFAINATSIHFVKLRELVLSKMFFVN